MLTKRSQGLFTFFGIIIISVAIYYLFASGAFQKWYYGGGELLVKGTKEAIAQPASALMESLQKTIQLIQDPTSIYQQEAEATPDEKTVQNKYGVYVTPPQLTISYCVCADASCSSANFIPPTQLYSIYARFPEELYKNPLISLKYTCAVNVPHYDKCFENVPSKYEGTIRGNNIIVTTIYCPPSGFNLKLNESAEDCYIQNSDGTKSLTFKDNGFLLKTRLFITYDVNTQTYMKSLVTTVPTFSEALAAKQNIYTKLGINAIDYDSPHYIGLLNHPHIGISRLNAGNGIPLLVDKQKLYPDILLFSFGPLDNVEFLSSLVITITPGDLVGVAIFDNSGTITCADSAEFSMGLFNISVLHSNGALIAKLKYITTSGITEKDVFNALKRNSNQIKFILPICIKTNSYEDVSTTLYKDILVVAKANYTYKISASSTMKYECQERST